MSTVSDRAVALSTAPHGTDHDITIVEVQLPAGRPLRASCLCGWQSPLASSRPQALTLGEQHRAGQDRGLSTVPLIKLTTELDRRGVVTRASHCSCGRPARTVLDGGRLGRVGYCGSPAAPLEACDCGQRSARHSRNVCSVYGAGMAVAR